MKKNKILLIIFAVVGFLLIISGLVLVFSATDITTKYKYIGQFSGDRLVVSDGIRYGYIDSKGNEIFPLEHKLHSKVIDDVVLDAYTFIDGIAPYYDNGVFGFIDSNGKVIINAEFLDFRIYSKDFIMVQGYPGKYIIDQNLNAVFKDFYHSIFTEDKTLSTFVVQNKDLKYGVLDSKEQTLIDFVFDDIRYLFNQDETDFLYVAKQNDNYRIYTKDCKLLNVPNVSMALWYDDNLVAYVDNEDVFNIYDISTNENLRYQNNYSYINPLSNDVYLAKNMDNNYGYLDSEYNTIIDFKYNYEASNFIGDYATGCTAKNNKIKCEIFDKSGNVTFTGEMNRIIIINENLYLVETIDENYYLIDKKGKKLTEEYKGIEIIENGKYFIVKDSKYAILNEKLEIVKESEYDLIKYNENTFTLKKGNDITFYNAK